MTGTSLSLRQAWAAERTKPNHNVGLCDLIGTNKEAA